jgi:CBS domain containing-hemolysin-like protein
MDPRLLLPGELLVGNRDLVYVGTKTKVQDLIKTLQKENISSVPVCDEEKNEFIGLVDMLDIISVTSLDLDTKDSAQKFMNYHELYHKFAFLVETAGEIVTKSPRSQVQ